MTAAREAWQKNLDELNTLKIGPKESRDHRADIWTVMDASYLLHGWSVRRWSPETRTLIYEARRAVAAAAKAMWDELAQRESE